MKPKLPEHKVGTLYALCIGILLVLLYVIGILQTTITGYGPSLNPIKIIQCFRQNGFPWGLWLGSFLITGLVLGYFLMRDGLRGQEDILGRLFFMTKKRQTYGDAHFESPKEYQDIALVQTAENALGTILGQLDDTGTKLINQRLSNTRSNRHIMVFGASGCGKTYTFVKPFCFQAVRRRESLVITDPDGGLFEDMAGYFQDYGYVVKQLNFVEIEHSNGWDCLKPIKEAENPELMAQLWANTVMSNLVEDLSSIYGSGPMSLLKACVLRVVLGDDYPDAEKNIKSVYDLIINPGGEAFLDTMFDRDALNQAALPCVAPYQVFKTGSPNLRGNLITNLGAQLQLFQNSLLCKVLSTDDIDLTLPGRTPCVFFCKFPAHHNAYRFVTSLFFSMLFTQLVEYAIQQPNSVRLPIPVCILADEFANIGNIPDFDKKMSTIRKHGISVCMVIQNLGQIQSRRAYGDTWEAIMGNCATLVALGINDDTTAAWFQKRIGQTTVAVETTRHAAHESLFALRHDVSAGEGKRDLLSYSELFRPGKDNVLIVPQDHNPIIARKYPNVLHPEAKKLRPVRVTDIPDIRKTRERQAYLEQEQQRIDAYYEKHPMENVMRDYTQLEEITVPLDALDGAKKKLSTWLMERYGFDTISKKMPVPAFESSGDMDTPAVESCAIDSVEVYESETFEIATEESAEMPETAQYPPEIDELSSINFPGDTLFSSPNHDAPALTEPWVTEPASEQTPNETPIRVTVPAEPETPPIAPSPEEPSNTIQTEDFPGAVLYFPPRKQRKKKNPPVKPSTESTK